MKKIFVALFLMLAPMRGWCVIPANPVIVNDPVRTLMNVVIQFLALAENPQYGAVFNVIQEEVAGYVGGEGEGGGAGGESAGSPATEVPAPAYDYVKANVLSSDKITPYAPLRNAVAGKGGEAIKNEIKKMFFWNTNQGARPLTEEKRTELLGKRTAYLTTIGKEYTKMAYEVQQKVMENMDSMSADIGGAGTLGEVSALDQTWRSINKTLIADIALQIQLMELDAARFLSIQPVEILEETQKQQYANAPNAD